MCGKVCGVLRFFDLRDNPAGGQRSQGVVQLALGVGAGSTVSGAGRVGPLRAGLRAVGLGSGRLHHGHY